MDLSLGPGSLAGFEPLTLGRISSAHRGLGEAGPGEGPHSVREDGVGAVVARCRVERLGRRLGAGERRSPGVEAQVVEDALRQWFHGWRDICRSTDERTVIAAFIPRVAVGDKYLLSLSPLEPTLVATLGGMFSSLVFDYCARQKIGGTSLKFFTLKQLPVLGPDVVGAALPWLHRGGVAAEWFASRVLELAYTATDMQNFGMDLGCEGPPFRWNESRRAILRAELDAAFFHLYGLNRADTDYVIETFPVLRKNEEKAHGEFRTKRLVLERYDAMAEAQRTGKCYQTLLDPPPADPRVAHPESTRPARAPRPAGTVPQLPTTRPHIDPQHEVPLVIWALIRASGGSIGRIELARAFALRSQPAVLAGLAPPNLAATANDWASRVGQGSMESGALAQALAVLADRDGIRLTTDGSSRSVLTTPPHTPAESEIDPWFRFEARLALAVLATLAPTQLDDVAAVLSAEDRTLLAAGAR